MQVREVAVAAILAIIIVAIGVYGRQSYKETHGGRPGLAREVFLLTDPATPSPTPAAAARWAAALRSSVATPGQVALYSSRGGHSSNAGLTSTGDVVAAPPGGAAVRVPRGYTHSTGVWLLGPKPGKGAVRSMTIWPFDSTRWFEPQT